MDFKCSDNVLTIFLPERIDSSNADAKKKEIDDIILSNKANFTSLELDAANLTYISSVGLRIVLALRKAHESLRVFNVANEIYDIFEMTGFTEIVNIEKAYRVFSVDGCKVIGKGAKGVVYRYSEDTIIKVYNNSDSLPGAKRERELARRAFILGIPTAISYDIVRVGETFGSVFELIEAKAFSDLIVKDEENRDKYIKEFALLLKKLNSTIVNKDDMPDAKEFVYKWVETAEPYLLEDDAAKLRKLIGEIPDTLNMLHCDYHTNNVLMQSNEAILIDMDTLSHGHPIFDLVNTYVAYVGFGESNPKMVEDFLGMPYELSKYVWKEFLKYYFDTSEAEIAVIENKIKVLAYTRLIRHIARRQDKESNAVDSNIIAYAKNINELLKITDTLTF